MLEAMIKARVWDVVFSEDQSINELEQMTATMFGMSSALLYLSVTITNQIVLKLHTHPDHKVACY